MSNVMSETERIEFLASIGLSGSGDLAKPVPAAPIQPVHQPVPTGEITLAPPGVDPRVMPVSDITFDPKLLDKFPSLEGDGLRAASDFVFSLYKSYGKNKERNSTLWREVGKFVTNERRNRQTGGMVKEQIKTTKEQRDLAALLASQNVTDTDLAEALRLLAERRAQ